MEVFRKQSAKIIKIAFNYFRKEKQLLLLIFIFGLLLRLSGLINISLAGDNLLHWKIAGEIVKNGAFPLLGPRASITGDFNLGPFYYYLLAVPYWLGGGTFKVGIVFFAILNSFSIPLLYFVSKRWFSKLQSLRISLLFACSAYFIQIQSFPWNPYVLPLFIILSLYFVNKIYEKKYVNVIFFVISYAICLQLHATAILLLPVFLYLMQLKKIPLKYYLLGMGIMIMANLPWIWINLTTNFSQVKAAFLIFNQARADHCSLVGWLANHGNGERCFWYFRNTLFAFRFLTISLFNVNNVSFALVGLAITTFYFIKTKLQENRYLFIWLFIPILLFLFYSNSIYLHYFLILTPVPFFLIIILLEKLEKKKGKWVSIAKILYFLIILINLCQYAWSLQFIRG